MERKIYTIMCCMLFLLLLKTQGNDKHLIYNAYVNNDMQVWKTVIDSLQKEKIKTNEQMLTLVNYQYGYIGWCIGKNKDTEAEIYIFLIEKNLAVLEKNNYNLSMIYAYKSALIGFKIGLNIFIAPFIGPQSVKYAENALKLDPENYFALMQMGNIQYYMPRIFGGSVNDAIRYFLTTKILIEKNNVVIQQDWNYLHLLTIIAQAYTETGDYKKAKSFYDTILKIEPQFQWIKDALYNELMQKLKN